MKVRALVGVQLAVLSIAIAPVALAQGATESTPPASKPQPAAGAAQQPTAQQPTAQPSAPAATQSGPVAPKPTPGSAPASQAPTAAPVGPAPVVTPAEPPPATAQPTPPATPAAPTTSTPGDSGGAGAAATGSETAVATPPQPAPRQSELDQPSVASAASLDDAGVGGEALDRPRFLVFGNLDYLWSTDRRYDWFSEDDVRIRAGVSVAAELLELTPRLMLVPEIGWGYEQGGDDSSPVPTLSSAEFSAHSLYLAAALRYRLLDWLHPQVRAQLGLSWLDLELEGGGPDERFEGQSTLPFGALGAGFTVETPDGALRGPLRVGLLVEGGYALASAADLNLDWAAADGRVPTEMAALGSWSRSGPYLRAAVFARF